MPAKIPVYEWRIAAGTVELRADGDAGESRHAIGHGAVFEQETEIYGIVEIVERSAFTKTIEEADVRALFNHEPDLLLGRSGAGTLTLSTDDVGLFYDIDLPDTSTGNDVHTLLRRKDLNGSSIGFRTIVDQWTEREDGTIERRIKEVALRDTGPVTFPAYAQTDAALRSLCELRSVSFDVAHELALKGELGRLLSPVGGDVHPGSEGEGRSATFIPHRSWVYA